LKHNPFQVVKDFEAALCEYTGAPYCVTTNSCTMALLLACKYLNVENVEIPNRTYVSVPMSIIHAGGKVRFRDYEWRGQYQLWPYPIWDSARWLTGNIWNSPELSDLPRNQKYICLSFHWNKTLGIQQGGAILHNNGVADVMLRRMRFDGRAEGVAPKDDVFPILGYHCYMSPEIAAEGLVRLSHLPKHNDPLPNDDYPDLSKIELFK